MAERARHAPSVCIAGVWLLSCALLVGCDGDFVNLGTTGPLLSGGDAGAGASNLAGSAGAGAQGGSALQQWRVELEPVVLQQEGVTLANPTLLGDLSQLYYTSQTGIDAPLLELAIPLGAGFGNATTVKLAGTAAKMFGVASPAVSSEGDELWVSLFNTAGNTDVFHCTRLAGTWSEPSAVSELSSPDWDDAPRPPGADGTIMPLSSKRHGGLLHQIYLAERANKQAAWGEPSQDLLGSINLTDVLSADGFLSADGTTLYFASTRDSADADLYVARRASLTQPFGAPEPLPELRSDYNERMPWVSRKGDVMYFVSDRPTPALQEYALYRATKL